MNENNSIIEIASDGSYVEILGHRIYRYNRWGATNAVNSWYNFLEYLHSCRETEKENKLLKAKLNQITKENEAMRVLLNLK